MLSESVGAGRHLGRPFGADGAATRASIIATAVEQLATIGFEAMKLEDVAAEVGISRAAVYHYFPSKKHLARAVLLESQPDIDLYYETFAESASCLADHLRALVKACMQVAFERQDPVLGFFQLGRLAEDDEAIARVFRNRTAGVRKTLRSLIADAVERGEIAADYDTTDVDEGVLGVIWAMASGAALVNTADAASARRQLELAADGLFRDFTWTARTGLSAVPGLEIGSGSKARVGRAKSPTKVTRVPRNG